MRVLHVIPSLDAADGGPSVAVANMVAALAAVGVECAVATTCARSRVRIAVNAPLVTFARHTRFYKCAFGLVPWLTREVARFDLVHTHALFSFAPLAAARAARSARVPYVMRPLGALNAWGVANRRPWLKRGSLALLEAPLLRAAARVHFTADAEAEAARAEIGPLRGAVIPLGVAGPTGPTALSHARDRRSAGPPTLLYLSRLAPIKNLEGLLDAWAQLGAVRGDAILEIAGDGDRAYLASLEARARGHGVAATIRWLGALDGAAKAAAFERASLFVLPSHSENFGNAVAEAAMAGLPLIVSTRVPLHAEITDAGAGWACGTDPDSIAAALGIALDPATDLRSIGARAVELARRRWSLDAMGHALKAMYEEILAEGAAR